MSTICKKRLFVVLVTLLTVLVGTGGGSGSCEPVPMVGVCIFNTDCADGQACLGGVCHEVCSPPEDPHVMCTWCGPDGGMTLCGPWVCRIDGDCPEVPGEVVSCEIPTQKGGGGASVCVWYPLEEPECVLHIDCDFGSFCDETSNLCRLCEPGMMVQGSDCEHVIYDVLPSTGLLVTWDQILSDLVVDDGAPVARLLFTANTEEDLGVSIEAFALLLSRLQMFEMVGDCRFVFGDGQAVFAPVYVLADAEMSYSYDISFVVLAGETEVADVECDLIGSFLVGDELTPAFFTPDDIIAEGIDEQGELSGEVYLVDISPQYGPTRRF